MAGGTLKSLLVKLGVDSKDFDKGMDHAEKRSGSMSKTFEGLTKVGLGITMGAAAGVGATALALGSTIKPASDLEEAINAVNVVFGDGAKEMTDYGKGAATAVGLSAREFNQLGAEMGAMLGNVGIAEDKLAGETISLVNRASDMASIFNTDVTQAFQAIQSAIKGEFNPLEAFGVKMNQAAINAKALEMGLGDLEGELSDSAKAQAALALVYEQTDKVAGDFQNTSEGLANSQRIMKAVMEDTKAEIGAALLPAMESLMKIVKDIVSSDEFKVWLDKVIEGVTKLGGWIIETVPVWLENFRKLSNWFKENEGVVVGILAAMGVAVLAFGISVATAAWAALVPLLPVIAVMLAVAAVAYLVYEAWTNNWGGIQDKVGAVIDWIKKTIENFKNMSWHEIGTSILVGISKGIAKGIKILKNAAVKAVKAAWNAAKNFLGMDSPSKLFADIGKFSMMGMAGGIDDYARVPAMATVDATRGIATTAGHADYPAAAPSQPVLDEAKLARMIRDAILKVTE